MRLFLDQTAIEAWPLAAGPEWVAGEYAARVLTGFGWPTLRVQFTDLVDRRDVKEMQHAWVGRIRLKRLPSVTPGPRHAGGPSK